MTGGEGRNLGHTILKLECGHDRLVGGNVLQEPWASGAAHLLTGFKYPCVDGHCGKVR